MRRGPCPQGAQSLRERSTTALEAKGPGGHRKGCNPGGLLRGGGMEPSLEVLPNVPLFKRARFQVEDSASLEILLLKSEMPFLYS